MALEGSKTVSSTTLITNTSSIDVSLIQRVLWLLNTFYHQVLAILTILLFWIFFDNYVKSELFFWHLFLSTAAYVPLMAAAIILFSEDTQAFMYMRRTKKYWVHGILLTVSCIAVSIGIGVEMHSKAKQHHEHFKSKHAILGLASWVLVFVAVVIGLVAGNAKTFASFIKPVIAKFLHNFLGIAGFVIGIGSLYMEMNIVKRYSSENVYITSKWALWFITIWSLWAAFKSLWSQLKGIFS